MSPSRPDILGARGIARPLKRLDAHLAAGVPDAPGLREVPIADLWLRHQPRKLVPDAVLDALLAADRAQPAALLAELQALAAAEPGTVHAATLAALHELAATIRVHGVLVPVRLARVDDRYVVEEGHRRSFAALLAGVDRLPAVIADSASDLLLAARQFVANDQRADLSALEKAAWLRELMTKADRELRLRQGWPADEPTFAALFEGTDEDEPPPSDHSARIKEATAAQPSARPIESAEPYPSDQTEDAPPPLNGHANGASTYTDNQEDPLSPWERAGVRAASAPDRAALEAHKGEVRAQVLSLTGLSLGRYYQLRQLNRLCPEARELAAGLTERHLRPIVVLSPEGQVLVVRAVLAHQVPANKVPALVRALADGGESALRRALATFGLPSPRGRVASSYTRLQFVPVDWPERVELVGQELRTIKATRARRTRLAQLAEQAERLEAVAAAYRAILHDHASDLNAE